MLRYDRNVMKGGAKLSLKEEDTLASLQNGSVKLRVSTRLKNSWS